MDNKILKNVIYQMSDYVQAQGFRVCPRNCFKDSISDERKSEFCTVCTGGHCRKRFATCWSKYLEFFEKAGDKDVSI